MNEFSITPLTQRIDASAEGTSPTNVFAKTAAANTHVAARVVVYARAASAANQDAIDGQIRTATSWLRDRDLVVDDHLVEISDGASLGAGLKALLEHAKVEPILLVTESTDRISRDPDAVQAFLGRQRDLNLCVTIISEELFSVERRPR